MRYLHLRDTALVENIIYLIDIQYMQNMLCTQTKCVTILFSPPESVTGFSIKFIGE